MSGNNLFIRDLCVLFSTILIFSFIKSEEQKGIHARIENINIMGLLGYLTKRNASTILPRSIPVEFAALSNENSLDVLRTELSEYSELIAIDMG